MQYFKLIVEKRFIATTILNNKHTGNINVVVLVVKIFNLLQSRHF